MFYLGIQTFHLKNCCNLLKNQVPNVIKTIYTEKDFSSFELRHKVRIFVNEIYFRVVHLEKGDCIADHCLFHKFLNMGNS